jgi:hypothetical protein
MSNRMNKWTSAKRRKVLLAMLAIPAVGLAQLIPGLPQVVFDPTQSAHVIAEIAQIVQLYKTAVNTYDRLVYTATFFTNKSSWKGIGMRVVNSETPSIFGETAGWTSAVSNGLGVGEAWRQSTYGINPPSFYSVFPVGNSSISANIASVNIADGASQAGMLSIGQSRLLQPLNDQALSNLEQASQGVTEDTNSEVQQLNLITSGTMLYNRQLQDSNVLLTAIAEQQIMTNKVQRDTIASNLNVMAARDSFVASEPTGWGGSAATISGYQQ